MAQLRIEQGRHYGDYIQSCENLNVKQILDEVYEFQVIDYSKSYESFVITPHTDLSGISASILEQLDTQMYMCGESDDYDERDAKFSKTRKHIQAAYMHEFAT